MKRDEPFDPDRTSSQLPEGLSYRIAIDGDRNALVELSAERNPTTTLEDVIKKTERELRTVVSDPKYKLFVADLKGEVV
ncbi:MAG: hypothetical protein AAB250_10015, partial [Bdellovibrionota bacterium]